MGLRFNPAPGWPPPPPGFVPPPHWQPDPSWPPAPPGWQLWVDDGLPDPPQPSDPPAWTGHGPAVANGGFQAAGAFPEESTGVQARPGAFGSGAADAPWAGDFGTGPGGFAGPGDAPPWAGDITGPQTAALRGGPAQAYSPGATGPQAPYNSGDLFSPQDPFTRRGPGAPPGGPGGPGRRAGAPGKANGLAVASLILGVLGITVIGAIAGIVLGILALGQIRRTGQRGRGMAIAGLALSALWLVLLGAYVVLHGGKSPTPPPASSGHSSSPTAGPSTSVSPGAQSTNVFALKPGQCFQNPPASQTMLGVTYVTVVPCSTPHNAQAYVQFTATGTGYPGVDALKRQADSGCHARITKNVQKSKLKNSMTLHYLYPLESSWNSGHKTITCLIVNSKPNLKTSLMRTHPGH